ncbi:MAG: LD-carboxypeptidase [Planctomycetes bacterium]|nr:LD-carboxypeptidase [Planctomycetota bacterium]
MPSAYLFCPAYPLRDQDQLSRALASARAFADSVGHELIASPDIAGWGADGAWPDADLRRRDFERALGHDLIIAARGGYGCTDLAATASAHGGRLPLLVGYSDLTVLHAVWRGRGAGESLYGFMPAAAPGERSLESASALARGEGLAFDSRTMPDVAVLRAGSARGPLFAACLRVLASLCGTPLMPPLRGCILALEDIDERPYQIDRDLAQLGLAGALDGVVGLVFGSFRSQPRAGYGGPDARDICRRWAERRGLPAIQALPFGHDEDPVTLACGREASLDCGPGHWSLRIHRRG